MARRETFMTIPLPNLGQWKTNMRAIWDAPGTKAKARAFNETVKIDQEETLFSDGTVWSNKDLDPIPPEQRTWRAWDYMSYWASDQFAIATWEFAASMVAQGFTLREIVPLTFVGMFITGLVCVMSGHIAAKYRIGFPMSTRMSWGMRFGWFPVLVRSFTAMMWLGILNLSIAQCIHQMLRAVWPDFDDIPNTLPESAGITSADLLCYFILIIIQTPLTLIPIYKLKWYFVMKAIISPMVFIGMMIWALVVTKNGGPLVVQAAHLEGSEWDKGWARLKAIGNASGLFATVACNIPDFSRYAKTTRGAWMQAIALPLTGMIPVICSVITCSACIQLYGESFWNPALILEKWENRAAVFFAAIVWIIATIGVNLSANTITVSIALTSFFPRYINNIRGSLLVAVISIIIVPWKIVYSSGSFYNFLNAYPCLIGPISGILLSDYWLVRRRSLDVRHLYARGGKFWFTGGYNWRAAVAWLGALAPNLPGFIHQIAPSVPDVQPYTYNFSWFFGIVISMALFWFCNYVWPPTYSLSGPAVHPDDVVDWDTRTRVGNWSDMPGSVIEAQEEKGADISIDSEKK
ncbi:hypothetical protein V2G26_002303 [Clonostachys chloroleuca]